MTGSEGQEQTPSTDRVRLHITPFNEALLRTYVPTAIRDSVTNISYHTLETFPEKPFGYLELPSMEAQKLKKKFNGTILKGTKVKVEEARPEKRRKSSVDESEEPIKIKKKKVRSEQGEVVGVALEEGRSVKRGWTESSAEQQKSRESKKDKKGKDKSKDKEGKKKREPSKYTNEPECLFRIEKLPPNIASAVDEKKKKKKKTTKGSKNGEIIIHEFEHTQKHASFLKSGELDQDTKVASEYVDGQGWVDGDGNVVEPETEARREKRERKAAGKLTKVEAKVAHAEEDFAQNLQKPQLNAEERAGKQAEVDAAEAQAEKDATALQSSEPTRKEKKKKKSKRKTPREDEPAPDLEIEPPTDIAEDIVTPSPTKQVHPLEALYKRPKPSSTEQPAPLQTSFSFFDTTEDVSPGADAPMTLENMPQTPFTERDLEWRGVRSAAPTPDTAAISRKFSWSLGKIAEDDDDNEDEDGDGDEEDGGDVEMDVGEVDWLGITNRAGGQEEKTESEFSKWFWENRGDTNRAWKKRRRDAMKIKRKRENRRLTRRIV